MPSHWRDGPLPSFAAAARLDTNDGVSLDDILAQLRALGLSALEDRVASRFLDWRYEFVPLKDIALHLRNAGVPAARAVDVRAALLKQHRLKPASSSEQVRTSN